MNTRQERLLNVFNHLRTNRLIKTQRDLARKIGSSESNVSNALKGSEAYLTDNFLIRINDAFNNIFNKEWLIDGIGEMLLSQPTSVSHKDNNVTVGVNSETANVTTKQADDDAKAVLAECKNVLAQVTTILSAATQMMNAALAMNTENNKYSQELRDKIARQTKEVEQFAERSREYIDNK